MLSISTLLAGDVRELSDALLLDAKESRIEVQMLMQHVLQVERSYLVAHPERELDSVELAQYRALLQRRIKGEPVAYILGDREFFGLNFKVTPATLIPRPDTELLVELALQHLAVPVVSAGSDSIHQQLSVLDLGTGSGAIALAIAHACPHVHVTAVDRSAEALAVARENAMRLNVNQVRWVEGCWYSALQGQRYSVIVSNPPYVRAGDPHLAQGDVRFEPQSALVSGQDGLDDIRHIVRNAPVHLRPDGWLLLEHGYDQASQVRAVMQQADFEQVFSVRDLSGIERVSGGCLACSPVNLA